MLGHNIAGVISAKICLSSVNSHPLKSNKRERENERSDKKQQKEKQNRIIEQVELLV